MNILITGARGTFGQAFGQCCDSRSLQNTLLDREQMDPADPASIARALDHLRPDACIHAVEQLAGEEGSDDRITCWRDSCVNPVRLAEACSKRDIRLVIFSSDRVFDGQTSEPYMESSPTSPRGARGRALAAAELAVLEAHRASLVIRTAALFRSDDPADFVVRALRRVARGDDIAADEGHLVSPTYLPDLVNAVLDLVLEGATGLWHVTNEGATTWYELARRACQMASLDADRVRPTGRSRQVLSTAMTSGRGLRLPPLEDALRRHLQAHRQLTA